MQNSLCYFCAIFLFFSKVNSIVAPYEGIVWGFTTVKSGRPADVWITKIITLDNGFTAVGYADGLIEVWDFSNSPNYKIVSEFNNHTSAISSIKQLTNGAIASSTFSGEIFLWKIGLNGTNYAITEISDPLNIPKTVFSLKQLPNGLLASFSIDFLEKAFGKIYVSNISDNRLLTIINTNYTAQAQILRIGNCLLTGSSDSKIQVWNVTDYSDGYELLYTINVSCPILSLLHVRANMIAISGDSNEIYIYNYVTGILHVTLFGHSGVVFSLINLIGHVTDSRSFIASTSNDSSVRVWAVENTFTSAVLIAVFKDSRTRTFSQLVNNNIVVTRNSTMKIWNFIHFAITTAPTATIETITITTIPNNKTDNSTINSEGQKESDIRVAYFFFFGVAAVTVIISLQAGYRQ